MPIVLRSLITVFPALLVGGCCFAASPSFGSSDPLATAPSNISPFIPMTTDNKESTEGSEEKISVKPAQPVKTLTKEERERLAATSSSTLERIDKNEALKISDVVVLCQLGVPNSTVISLLQQTETSHELSKGQIEGMQKAGISQEVIDYMVERQGGAPLSPSACTTPTCGCS